jgi:hypothetical protein
MLRFLYRCVLRAHPASFRQRFADEMLSIYDQAEGKLSAAKLLVDGVISLLRQWALRPEFWQEAPPALAATGGAPLFYTFDNPKPRTAALFYGALLSAMVLNGVCWTMGYAWNHPRFMDIRPGYGPAGRVPASQLISRPLRRSPAAAEPPLSTDAGRVLLVFKSPVRVRSAAPSEGAAGGAALSTTRMVSIDLQAYSGTYVTASAKPVEVLITVEAGRLYVEFPGEVSGFFGPASLTRFVAADVPDCWIEFVANSDGVIDRAEVYCRGEHVTALRR